MVLYPLNVLVHICCIFDLALDTAHFDVNGSLEKKVDGVFSAFDGRYSGMYNTRVDESARNRAKCFTKKHKNFCNLLVNTRLKNILGGSFGAAESFLSLL